jgi:rhodanese-related sulfurtransferase
VSTEDDVELRLTPFEPELHISPFRLFRRLHEAREGRAEAPVLLDVREGREPSPAKAPRLRGARPLSGTRLPENREVVLIDRDGTEATAEARRLRQAGHRRVRALYGGLDLYDFALDPAVVGAERFLEG